MHIVIVGAGASGLMAAITAARHGVKVTVLEHTSKIGKKIELTGNGKCNFTNAVQAPACYRTNDIEQAATVLDSFSHMETLRFFKELGIYPKNKNGYFYPASGQATSILDVLRMEAEYRKVKFACNIKISSIEKKADKFFIHTEGYTYEADKVILATGSMAAPATGSDGTGYELAKKAGHHLLKPLPALVPLKSKDKRLQSLAGLRAEAEVHIFKCQVAVSSSDTEKDRLELLASDKGEVQFVQNAISGIPTFQVSRFAVGALEQKETVLMKIDFMPDFSTEGLYGLMDQRRKECSYKTLSELLIGLFHKKLIKVLIETAGLKEKIKADQVDREELMRLAVTIKNLEFEITGSGLFEQAQACSGGVPLSEIEVPSMESKIKPGLYFAGELLDVDGACGGYNLQWAWSSGYCAGLYAAKGEL